MLREKRALSIEELEAQTALELPERETPLVTIVITCLVCIRNVDVRLRLEDINVAAQICAQLNAIQVNVLGSLVNAFECTVRQR